MPPLPVLPKSSHGTSFLISQAQFKAPPQSSLCSVSVAELRNKVTKEHEQGKQRDDKPKASYGYGGKFGVEKDRMDKVLQILLFERKTCGRFPPADCQIWIYPPTGSVGE